MIIYVLTTTSKRGSTLSNGPLLLNLEIKVVLVTSIANTYFALLTKWLWKYHYEPKALWRSFIHAQYTKSYMGSIPYMGRYSSTNAPWRSVRKGIEWFNGQVTWKINNGRNLSFWHGAWNIDKLLKHKIPRLYSLFLMKNGSIKDAWNDDIIDWDIQPRRPLK